MKLSLLDFNFNSSDNNCCYYFGNLDELIDYILDKMLFSVYKKMPLQITTTVQNDCNNVSNVNTSTMILLTTNVDNAYECELHFQEQLSHDSNSLFKYMLEDCLVLEKNRDDKNYFHILNFSMCQSVVNRLILDSKIKNRAIFTATNNNNGQCARTF